jgi:signal transduction histidine kinase
MKLFSSSDISNSTSPATSAARLLIPLIGLVVLAILTVGATVYLAAQQLDQSVMDSSGRLARTALGQIERQIAVQAREYAYWDATRANVVDRLDMDWVNTSLGKYSFETFDYDSTLVIDRDNKLLLFATDERPLEPGAAEPLSQSNTQELLQKLALPIARVRAGPMDVPTSASACIRIGGTVYVAGVAPVTPEHPTEDQLVPAPRPVLIYLRALDDPRMLRIGETFEIQNFRVSQTENVPDHFAQMTLRDPSDTVIGHMQWMVLTPTQSFFKTISMPFLAVGLVLLALAAWVMSGILRRHEELASRIGQLAKINARLLDSESQARSALQRAEHATRTKNNFLASVSHELRTPLTAIIGFSQILKLRRRPGKVASREDEYAEIIHDSSQHLLNLVNDILDLAKIESGGYEMQEIWLDLNREAKSVQSLMGTEAMKRGVTLDVMTLNNPPALLGDSRSIKQILTNLVSNALKFTPSGGRTDIRISLKGRSIVLEVEDTGTGIAEDDLDVIWEPFNRTRNPDLAKTEGSGLGLHLVKVLAELHGCEIELESEVGRGTRIAIIFPPERVRSVAA